MTIKIGINGFGRIGRMVFRAAIANFKVPKKLFIVADLPRNAMGKVQKNLLREQHKALFS